MVLSMRFSSFSICSGKAFLAVAVAFSLFCPSAMAQTPKTPANYNLLSPTEQYLTLRRLYPPVAGLTPDAIAQNANAYRGVTLELEGTLTGIAGRGQTAAGQASADATGGTLLMLEADGFGSLNLRMSALPTWVQTGNRLRVLVVVPPAADGNITVGMPDLQVVAVAGASDIAAVEFQWRKSEEKRIAEVRQREAAVAAYRARMAATATRTSAVSSSASRATRSSRSAPLSFSRIAGSAVIASLSADAQRVFPEYRNFITRWNPRLTDNQADGITASLLLYCERYDVDPRLMVALIIAESDFRPGITSNKGAMGIAQLMPDETQELGLTNPYDPVQNIAGAVYLMRRRLDKYSGGASQQELQMQHIILALASYNAGEGAVKKYKGVPPYRETQNYVKKIERIYRQLCQSETQGPTR